MRLSTGLLILLLPLFLGCQRQTGFCEASGDCPNGEMCSAETHLCSNMSGGPLVELTVSTLGDGMVSVDTQMTPCSGSCKLMLPKGAGVRLTARPAGNTRFTGWSDGCSGDSAACVVVLNSATMVTANFTPKICYGYTSVDNWCWETPLPQGNSLESVWSFSDTDAWAVGNSGTILRWNGTSWSQSVSNTTANLHSVWGKTSGDIWAVGDGGTILHYSNNNWQPVPSGTTIRLNAVWGNTANDIWVVGAVAASTLTTILHYTGTSFTSVSSSSTFEMFALWGSGDKDIWAVGDKGYSLHYNGTTWNLVQVNVTGQPVYSISGSGATDVWAVGAGGAVYRSGGVSWGAAPVVQGLSTANLRGVSVTAANELFAVGDSGVILRFANNAWSFARNGVDNGLLSIYAPAGNSAIAWTVGQGGAILRKNPGAAFTTVYNTPFVTPYNLFQSIWGSGSDDIWVVGYYGVIYHFDGASFRAVRSNVSDSLFEIWGSGPKDIWAVGANGVIVHYDGNAWLPVPSGTTASLFGVWGSGPNDIWAVGAGSTVTHYNGQSWTSQTIPSGSDIYGVWGRAANDVWAVGRVGYYYRFNGTSWSVMPSAGIDLTGVFGTSTPNDVWVVGRNGLAMHYEGTGFMTKPTSAAGYDLYRIWGSSPQNLWAVGFAQAGGGIIVKGNGTSFTTSLTLSSGLTSIYGSSASDIFVTGFFGAVLHNPTALTAF